MRYAIISDIHSNLHALTAVLRRIDSLSIDKTICLGDIVGYNARPNECVDLIRERRIISTMGNHETRACALKTARNFNPAARASIEWTRRTLTKDNLTFLSSLPLTLYIDKDTIAFHARLDDEDRYIRSESAARLLLEEIPESVSIAFFGHTHKARAYSQERGLVFEDTSGKVVIAEGERLLVNPGSVGQPRDYDTRAALLVYDKEKRELLFERVEYPVEKSSKEVITAGLATSLAERLLTGR